MQSDNDNFNGRARDRRQQPQVSRHERGIPEAFGFSVPPNHRFADVASEERRGRFFGRGPKGYRRSDERIREEISDTLMRHPDIDASDIEVEVSKGVVSLTGTVEDRHEKRLAELIAEDPLGVDDVDNRLKVRHGFWASLVGEHAMERQVERPPEPADGIASREGARAEAARTAARRDAEAR